MRRRIMPVAFLFLCVVSIGVKWAQPSTEELLRIDGLEVVKLHGVVYLKPEIYALETFRGQYWTQLSNAKTGRDVYHPKWSEPPRAYTKGKRYRALERLTWWTDQPILDMIPGESYTLRTCYRAVLSQGRLAEETCIKPVTFVAPIPENGDS